MTVDDMASRAEAFFLDGALERQRRLAALAAGARRGVCTNCGEPCATATSYCDSACRDDFERRLRAGARNGSAA